MYMHMYACMMYVCMQACMHAFNVADAFNGFCQIKYIHSYTHEHELCLAMIGLYIAFILRHFGK